MKLKLRHVALATALALAGSPAVAAPAPLATLSLGRYVVSAGTDAVLGKVFFANSDSGSVSVVDVAKLVVSATIPVGSAPTSIVVNSAAHRAYVANDTTPGAVTVVDTQANAVLATIPVGNRPQAIRADFQRGEVYVTNRDSNTLSVIDVKTSAVVATIAVGKAPVSFSLDKATNKLYVPASTENSVVVVDRNTRSVVRTVPVGKNPRSAVVDERVGKVYVNNRDDKTVTVINSKNDTAIKTLPSGADSTFATISAVYHRAYLPNFADGTLTVIDTDGDAVTKTLHVGDRAQGVVVDEAGGDIYVAITGEGKVVALEAKTELFNAYMPSGQFPGRTYLAADRLLVLNYGDNAVDTLAIEARLNSQVDTTIVTDYYHAAFDHYFHSASAIEARVLDDGVFGDAWHRSQQYWRVWTAPGAGRLPVCRFFSTEFGAKSSHFYTPYASECASLKAGATWQYEETSYYVAVPDANGSCAPGTEPLYRLYNQGQGGAPNHRYTPDRSARNAMLALGWVAEGSGVEGVFACTPPLRG